MVKIKYKGPGNLWNVFVKKSALTGKSTSISGVKFRTACVFVKTHTIEY